MTDDNLESAWAELHDATPPGWHVGRPGQRHGGQWALYAFDATEKAHIGKRSREWTAVGNSEEECVREMARCLRELRQGPHAESSPKQGASTYGQVCNPALAGTGQSELRPRAPAQRGEMST